MIFEGAIAVKAAMLAGRRKVTEIVYDRTKKDRNTNFILQQANSRDIAVRMETREAIDTLADGKTHGGIIAYVEERTYQTLEEVLQIKHPFLVVLEGIEDPFNFAYALRSLYAAGCDGVLVNERNWTSAADVIVKGSAGASEYMRVIVCKDMQESLRSLKKHQIKIICAMREDAIPYYEEDWTQGFCLCIGGEMRGLSSSILEESMQNIYIPYGSDFRNALTASSATAILAFEACKQRAK